MDKRTGHAKRHAKGSIKEAIGMLIGDTKVQAEGAAEKANSHPQHIEAGAEDRKTPSGS